MAKRTFLEALFKQCPMALAQVQHSVGSTKPLLPKTQSQDDVAAEVAMTYTVYSKTGKCTVRLASVRGATSCLHAVQW